MVVSQHVGARNVTKGLGKSTKCSQLLSHLSSHIFFFFFFETGFVCAALAVLELTLYTRLVSNSEIRLPLSPECWD
jgi:hypothetical protein